MTTDQHKNTFSHDLLCGLKGRCPNCGEGKMFRSFLKIADQCPDCGEELHHHRADDLPAYYSILITGHIVVTAALSVETHYHPDYWVHVALWLPLTLALALGLLQPIKGAVAALQWRMGMHGFRQSRENRRKNTPLS